VSPGSQVTSARLSRYEIDYSLLAVVISVNDLLGHPADRKEDNT